MKRKIAALYCQKNSIYKTIPDVEVYDEERNALNFPGDMPVIAHPPCRTWCQLSHMATRAMPGEKELALHAVKIIQKYGGILEHPAKSKLWKFVGLPEPGERDAWNGFTISLPQFWFGHPCDKATRFYICGIEPKKIPSIPMKLGEAEFVQTYSHKCRRRKQMPHSLREHTPIELALWLVEIARNCSAPKKTSP